MNIDFHENMKSPSIFAENGLESCEMYGIPSDYILIQSDMVNTIDDTLLHMNSVKSDSDMGSTDHFQYFSAAYDLMSKGHGLYPMKFELKSEYESKYDPIVVKKEQEHVVIEEVAEEVISDCFDPLLVSSSVKTTDLAGDIPLLEMPNQSKLSYQCYKCGETFYKKKSLINHIHSHDTGALLSKHSIQLCEKREFALLMEENLNELERSFYSLYPEDIENSRIFDSNGNSHGSNHTRVDTNELGKLDTKYTYRKNAKHGNVSKRVRGAKERDTSRDSLVCSYCGKRCKDYRGLQKHSAVHSDGQMLSCSTCGKQFYSRTRLKRHMATHRDKAVSCLECGEKMADHRDLANHRSSHHVIMSRNGSVGRTFPCRMCDKIFSCRSSQQIHIRVHTGERPFNCSYCVKAFADGGTLRKHERIHTGEKPYACPICVKAFNQRVVLREHIRAHHTGSNITRTLHKCEVCNEVFGTTQDLCLHLVKHADDNTAKHRTSLRMPRKYRKRKTSSKEVFKNIETTNQKPDVSVVIPNRNITNECFLVDNNDNHDKLEALESLSLEQPTGDEGEFQNVRIYIDANDNLSVSVAQVSPAKWNVACTSANDVESETHTVDVGYQLLNSFSGKLPDYCSTVESSCDINSCLNSIEKPHDKDLNNSFSANNDCNYYKNKNEAWFNLKDKYDLSFENEIYVHSGLGLGATVELQSEF